MSSSIFFKGRYGYQNVVTTYLKPLFQTIILISGCKCFDSTSKLKNPTGRNWVREINNNTSCAYTQFISPCCQNRLHISIRTTNVSKQRKWLCKMLLTQGQAPCGWMCWGTAETEERSFQWWIGWRREGDQKAPQIRVDFGLLWSLGS